jgi:hypothetical protein
MGQPIRISSTTLVDRVAVFDIDRIITGQDGVSYRSSDEADGDDSVPGRLASSIFAADPDVDHVFVASNQIVVRSDGGWDDPALRPLRDVIARFFVFYRDAA